MKPLTLLRCSMLLALLCATPVVHADPPLHAHDDKPHGPQAFDGPPALQAIKAARSKGDNASGAQPPRAATANEARAAEPASATSAPNPALASMRAAARRASRDQARKARHREIKQRLAGREAPPALRSELRTHARRTARLQRVRALAAQHEPALLARIDAVIARENERHERRLSALIASARPAQPRPGTDDEGEDEVEE